MAGTFAAARRKLLGWLTTLVIVVFCAPAIGTWINCWIDDGLGTPQPEKLPIVFEVIASAGFGGWKLGVGSWKLLDA